MAMDMTTALTIKANVVGQSDIGSLEKSLGKVSKQTDKASTAMGRFKTAANGALGAMRTLLPALGVAGIAAFAKSNLDAADSMSKLSQRTGIAAPTLDKFRKVAELSDTSIESLERAFPALTKNMDMAAQKGKGPAFEAFQRLGVAVKDANGDVRDADAVMLDIADRFQGMADGTEKAALASAVFGTRIGSELIPLLNSGGDAVRDMGTSLTQDFADKAAAFNDRLEKMQEKFGDLGLRLTESLLPALEGLVGFVEGALNLFNALPGPLQSIIGAVAALAAGMLVLSPIIPLITGAFSALGALKIGATIAGWLPVITSIGSTISGILPIITGVLTGPVGWVALLVGAGAAVYAFRDEIGAALSGIAEFFAPAIDGFMTLFVDPLIEAGQALISFFTDNWTQIVDFVTLPFQQAWDFINGTFLEPIGEAISSVKDTILTTWSELQQGLISPFEAAAEIIKGVLNSALSLLGNVVNGYIDAINNMIQGVNKITGAIGIPAIPTIPNVEVPQFAKGGMVNGAQLAVVGEAGPEYIVPAGKAQGFAQNILAGVRGPGAIPAYAEGGYVGPVNITTGPVMQQGGTNYVTMAQFEAGVRDVAAAMTRSSRSYGSRRFTGIS
jgi:hypothetical protein